MRDAARHGKVRQWDALNLISTPNIAAFNAGIALGSWIGGLVIGGDLGFIATPPTASLLALAALPLCLIAQPLAKRI